NITHFYKHESCGWGTRCREGTRWLYKVFDRMHRYEGRPGDVELLYDLADKILGKSFCALADPAAMPVQSSIKKFREDCEGGIKHVWGELKRGAYRRKIYGNAWYLPAAVAAFEISRGFKPTVGVRDSPRRVSDA